MRSQKNQSLSMMLNCLASDGTFLKVCALVLFFLASSLCILRYCFFFFFPIISGGFKEFGLMERLGEGKKPTAIIGEVADDLNLDLVVLSMEAIHSKHVDANLLAEFIPCPVLLLPL